MVNFTYGPVDLIAAAFDSDMPDPIVLAELATLVDAGQVRVLDILVAHRGADGMLEIDDLDLSAPGNEAIAHVELLAPGVVAADDVEALVAELAPGSSATVAAIELTWAKQFASTLASVGGVVLETVRIPAPVVNAVLDTVPTS